MESKYLFIISSSINHFNSDLFSVYTSKERFEQTLETINSIKVKVPNSSIVLFDLSEEKIDENYSNHLKSVTDVFFEYYNDSSIQNLYDNFKKFPNLFMYGKSLVEMYGLIKTLTYLEDSINMNNIKRIFKITGRYKLNDFFEIKEYESKFLTNKYICKTFKYSDFEPETNAHFHIYKNKGFLVTGLWSFDTSLTYETIDILEKSFQYLQILLKFGDGNDIEHSLYQFIDKNKLIECDELGLTVIKGMDNEIYDI